MTERLEGVVSAERTPGRVHTGGGAETTGSDPAGADSPVTDLALLIPERLARAIDRRRAAWSPVDTGAAWLIGLHLLLLLVIVGRGSYYLDDLRAQGYAVHQPFWQFIGGSNGTHFAPIPRILDWTQSRWFPLEHFPATVITLLIRLLLAAGFWRVLRRMFGPRVATLVPLSVLLFSPLLIPATTWYRQSITLLACTVAIVWAIDAHLRWVLYRHWVDLVVLVLVTAIGLGCLEKAAAIPVILLAVTLAIFAGGPKPRPARAPTRPVRAGLVAVFASAVVVAGFLVIYRSGPYDQGSDTPPTALDVLHLTWDVVNRTVIPLLLGGPYQWAYPAQFAGIAQISATVKMFTLVIVLVGLAVALRRGPSRTGRALVLLLAWTVPSVAIVAAGRFAQYGSTLADVVRLWSDLGPAFLLSAALAALPWQVGAARSAAPARGPVVPRLTGVPREITIPALAGGLALAIVIGGSLVSSLAYASKWWDNPTGQWIASARLTLKNAAPYPRILATPLPETIMPSWVSLTFPTDAPLLLLLRPDTQLYNGDGEARVMNASGVPSTYLPVTQTETKKAAFCAATMRPGATQPATLRFPKTATYRSGAQVEIGLLLAESTKVEVAVVTPEGRVLAPQRFSDDELPQGPHTLRLPVPYGQSVSAVQVRTPGKKINCVAYARIWVPVA